MRYPNTPSRGQAFDVFGQAGTRRFPKRQHAFLEQLAGGRILDLGCGYGSSFISGLIRHGIKGQYVHLDQDPCALLRKGIFIPAWMDESYTREQRTCADACTLPFADSSFDVVNQEALAWDNDALDEGSFLAEITRILRPGGFYFTSDCWAPESFEKIDEPISHYRKPGSE